MRLRFLTAALLSATTLTLGGCATTGNGNPQDPLEPVNRSIFTFNENVDKAVLKPVAQAYHTVLPQIVRTGVGNFFSNLDDVVVLANDLLQFKLSHAASDAGRVFVNTTVGIYGLIDVGTYIGLEKHNEDFGQTLGRWGLGNGPYLVLPLLGPSTLRDTTGIAVDSHVDPLLNEDEVSRRNAAYATKAVDTRARLLDAEKIVSDAALDKYEFIREAYLQRRRNQVYDGNPPREKMEDLDADEVPGK